MAKQTKKTTFTHCKVRSTTNIRAPWRVYYTTEDGGKSKRVFKSFADEEKAYDFAHEREFEISNHGIRYGDIPTEVRRAYDFFRDESTEMEAIGAAVPKFEDLVKDALQKIRAAHDAALESRVPVAEAVADFIAYKTTRVKSRQLTDLTVRLKRFAQDFGTESVASVTSAQVEKWLASLRNLRNPEKLAETPLLSPLSRNHYRAALHAFFAYASAPSRGLCPINPLTHLEPEQVSASEPEAYTVKDAERILQTALDHKPELVPVLVLGFFCGLRVSEAITLDLGKLPRTAGEEFRTTGKTGPRMAPYTSAAAAWMKTQKRRTGAAWTQSPRLLVDAMQELFTLAKVDQINNGARHSFISYRTAETKDVAAVADECGNSVSTIKNHYRKLVTKAQATAYFTIRPQSVAKNITAISNGRKTSA